MLGLAILFGLGLWLLATIVAMVIGATFGRRPATKLLGAFLGFMLTMGGFIVYWTVEYYQIQRTVTHLCETEGGITVYVTPEEWRKQIGEEWDKLSEDWKHIDHNLMLQFDGKTYYGRTQLNQRVISYKAKDERREFDGKTYYGRTQLNQRVISYKAKDERRDIIRDSDEIFVDKNTHQVLFHSHYFSVGSPAIANSLRGLKFWLNNIDDCYSGDWSYEDRFFHREYTNYQSTNGE